MYPLIKRATNAIVVKYLAALFIFSLATIYITFPLIFHLTNMISGKGDELLITLILNWNIHSFFNDLPNIFNLNIFYPYHNTLAYSDPLFLSSLISVLPVRFFGEPIVAFNINLISSLVLLGTSIFALTYHVTKKFIPSIISGLLVLFSPPFLNETPHLQVIAIYFVPLSILFFLKFIQEKKHRYFLISFVLFVLQTYNSFLPGYFIFFSLGIICLLYFAMHKKEAIKLITKKNILVIIVSFSLIIPIAIPYFRVSREFHYVRNIRDTIHFALQPEDLLYPHELTRLSPILLNLVPKYHPSASLKPGFIGLIFSLLAIISIIYFIKNFKFLDFKQKSLAFIALLSFLLSFGPFLHIGRHTIHHPFPIPLPYIFFYYLIPGFNGMRNSARWEILFIIIAAILIGILLSKLLNSNIKSFIAYCFIIVLIVGEFKPPLRLMNIEGIKQFPKYYYFLKDSYPNSSIIEMPIYNWDMFPYANRETLREYYSILNFNKTVNGFSGFSPPEWEKMTRVLTVEFPSKSTIQKLEKMKVDYVIVHKDEYERMFKDKYDIRGKFIKSPDEIMMNINKYEELGFIKKFGDTYIYKLK